MIEQCAQKRVCLFHNVLVDTIYVGFLYDYYLFEEHVLIVDYKILSCYDRFTTCYLFEEHDLFY